ncbi:hypothetical protein [Winogradskyella sp. PE311]|uniref:hypothetical protein n=1 Tax=Winogradskyella sp. PE311 TaxID=3366943 RepID=UPI003980571B
MKFKLFLIITLISFVTANAQKDYIITIDGKSYEIEMDSEIEIKIKGKKLDLGLRKKDTLLLDEDYFQLKYTKKHKVSKVTVEEGIDQLMIMTAGGSGVIVQKYSSFNPTMLQEMMLNEVTKESVSYGYSLVRKDYDKKLLSGETIKVLKAVLDYKGETETYEIAAHGKKDEGILVMTMDMGLGLGDGGPEMVQLMWDTLKIK